MKIMFVIPSLGSGGAERVSSILANSFCGLGHQVTIVLIANDNKDYFINDQVKIICVAKEWKEKHSTLGRIIKRIHTIRKIAKKENPDIIISFMAETNIDTSIALLGCHLPLIVSERNDPAIDPPDFFKKLLRNLFYFRPDGFVFQTEDARDYFRKYVRKRSTIILNPLTTELPIDCFGEKEKKVVSVGRLEKQKNYPLLLKAFEAFHRIKPEYFLEIYGEGTQDEAIRKMIVERGLADCVKLMGFCKNVHEKIKTAALFVMSSDYEGLPNALIEAMALGLPCISTDCPCGGPRSLINNKKNALLVKVNDEKELLGAMIDILENPEYKDIGEKAKEIKIKLDPQIISQQWLDFIRTIRGQKRNAC